MTWIKVFKDCFGRKKHDAKLKEKPTTDLKCQAINTDSFKTDTTIVNQIQPSKSVLADQASQQDIFTEKLYEKITIKQNKKELHDLSHAVKEFVGKLMKCMNTRVQHFSVGEVVATGSCFDGTKIIEPNEFDFLVIIEQFSVANFVRVYRDCTNEGYAHAVVNRVSLDAFATSTDVHGKSLKANKANNSFREIFRNHFHSLLLDVALTDFSVKTSSGNLILEGFRVSINGPQCNVQVVWETSAGENKQLSIDIDITPAIKCEDVEHILNSGDTAHTDVFRHLSQAKHYYLIPRPQDSCCLCFKLVFPEADQMLVSQLSWTHKRSFMILKYLSTEIVHHEFSLKTIFNSFAIKMAVFHHSFTCGETFSSLNGCLLSILQLFLSQLQEDTPTLSSVFIVKRNLWSSLSAPNSEQNKSAACQILKQCITHFSRVELACSEEAGFVKWTEQLQNACRQSISLRNSFEKNQHLVDKKLNVLPHSTAFGKL